MPTASENYLNKIYKYIGTTTTTEPIYINNNYYQCVKNNFSYKEISIELPIASEEYLNKIYMYIGEGYGIDSPSQGQLPTADQNTFYQCIKNSSNQYEWKKFEQQYYWKDITNTYPIYKKNNVGVSYNFHQYVTNGTPNYDWQSISGTFINTNNFLFSNDITINKPIHYNASYYNNSSIVNLSAGGYYILSSGNWIDYRLVSGEITENKLSAIYPEKRVLPNRLLNFSNTIYKYIGNNINATNEYYYNYIDDAYQSLVTNGSIYNFPTTERQTFNFGSIYVNSEQSRSCIATYNSFEISDNSITGIIDSNNNPSINISVTSYIKRFGQLINGGDRLYIDTNIKNFMSNKTYTSIKYNNSSTITTLNNCSFIRPAKTLYIEHLPKDLSNTSAIFYIDKDYYNKKIDGNVTTSNNPQIFKNFTNGTIILSGILKIPGNLSSRPTISSEFRFENCNCNIIIKNIAFSNLDKTNKTYKEYTYRSNLNIINCSKVTLDNVSTLGHNYTDDEITSDWYRPALYSEESTSYTLYNDIFIYNSNVNIINKLVFRDSGIGIYATMNSNVSINCENNICFNIEHDYGKITFKKRQVVTFATKNSRISLNTGNEKSTKLTFKPNNNSIDIPVYDTDILSGASTNNNMIKTRALRMNSVPFIYGLTDFGSIFNHNHTKIQPNPEVRFDTLSGNLPNGAIYFQGIKSKSSSTNIDTLTSNWNDYFNIKKTDKYIISNTNKISKNTTSNNYLFPISDNLYDKTTYSNIFDIYGIIDVNNNGNTFSLPTFTINKVNTTDANVVPVVKNFEYYAVRKTTNLK